MESNGKFIGPFFYIRGKLIDNACSLAEGREQAGKLDNSYGHDQLYDDHFKTGEYIDYPLCYVPNMMRGHKYNEITKSNADYFRYRRIYMKTKQIISLALMLALLRR